MNERLYWMFPSLFLGRMFLVDVRISAWFGLLGVVLCFHHGLELGLAVTLLFGLFSFFHELAHVIAVRSTGGFADEMHLTPFGGLGTPRFGHGSFSVLAAAAAGPTLNLAVCLFSFPGWYAPQTLWSSLNPFVLPVTKFNADGEILKDILLITFNVNWVMFLVNLLPAAPFDGGTVVRALLSLRVHPELVQHTAFRIGLTVSIMLLLGGAIADLSQVVLIGTFILMVNAYHLIQEDSGDPLDESGYGYDFSSAFDSLESPNPTATRQAKQGLLQRWRERRRIRREQQERIRRMEAEQQLDSLLAKVHETGFQSLSDQEQAMLRDCSELLRDRQKGED